MYKRTAGTRSYDKRLEVSEREDRGEAVLRPFTLRGNATRRTARLRSGRRPARLRRAESPRNETESFGRLALEPLGHRCRDLSHPLERSLVRDGVAEIDQSPAGLVVGEVADLAGVQTVEIGENLVDR